MSRTRERKKTSIFHFPWHLHREPKSLDLIFITCFLNWRNCCECLCARVWHVFRRGFSLSLALLLRLLSHFIFEHKINTNNDWHRHIYLFRSFVVGAHGALVHRLLSSPHTQHTQVQKIYSPKHRKCFSNLTTQTLMGIFIIIMMPSSVLPHASRRQHTGSTDGEMQCVIYVYRTKYSIFHSLNAQPLTSVFRFSRLLLPRTQIKRRRPTLKEADSAALVWLFV